MKIVSFRNRTSFFSFQIFVQLTPTMSNNRKKVNVMFIRGWGCFRCLHRSRFFLDVMRYLMSAIESCIAHRSDSDPTRKLKWFIRQRKKSEASTNDVHSDENHSRLESEYEVVLPMNVFDVQTRISIDQWKLPPPIELNWSQMSPILTRRSRIARIGCRTFMNVEKNVQLFYCWSVKIFISCAHRHRRTTRGWKSLQTSTNWKTFQFGRRHQRTSWITFEQNQPTSSPTIDHRRDKRHRDTCSSSSLASVGFDWSENSWSTSSKTQWSECSIVQKSDGSTQSVIAWRSLASGRLKEKIPLTCSAFRSWRQQNTKVALASHLIQKRMHFSSAGVRTALDLLVHVSVELRLVSWECHLTGDRLVNHLLGGVSLSVRSVSSAKATSTAGGKDSWRTSSAAHRQRVPSGWSRW